MPVSTVMDDPTTGIDGFISENDEAITSAAYAPAIRAFLEHIYTSAYWMNKAPFSDFREQLNLMASLGHGWDSQGAAPPNANARTVVKRILGLLETASLPPTRLTPTVEGGIALSFVEDSSRAVIEVYNTGEIAAATYSDQGEPAVWEFDPNEVAILDCIRKIRVHLTA